MDLRSKTAHELEQLFQRKGTDERVLRDIIEELQRRRTQVARSLLSSVQTALLRLQTQQAAAEATAVESSADTADMWIDPHSTEALTAGLTIDRLREKLLDTSGRNRLINLRLSERSRTHVRIVDVALDSAFSRISAGNRTDFQPLEEPPDEPADEQSTRFEFRFAALQRTDPEYLRIASRLDQDNSDHERRFAEAERALKDRVREELGMAPRLDARNSTPQDIARAQGINPSYDLNAIEPNPSQSGRAYLQTLHLPSPMSAKLNALRTGARRALEETGVNGLFAVFGFLQWKESSSSQLDLTSPLLMLPVEFDANAWRYGRRFAISGFGEEPILNPSLRARLARDETIELPNYDPETLPSAYLQKIATVVSVKSGWRVRKFLTVGMFDSTGITMWNDLDPFTWPESSKPASHSVVANLLAGSTQGSGDSATIHDIDSPKMVDRVPHTVLPADASQMSSIVDALEGKNLAIKGPPGTGKSQSIANLIAAALERGVSVLFVAEKMAALDVVKKRLEDVGLGEFVLELHSTHARKADVYGSFNERLGVSRESDPSGYSDAIDRAHKVKTELNDYVELMHRPLGPTGMTLHQAIWRLQRLSAVDAPSGLSESHIENALQLDGQTRESIRDNLAAFSSRLSDVLRDRDETGSVPWGWVSTDLTPGQQSDLVRVAKEFAVALRDLLTIAERLGDFGAPQGLKIDLATLSRSSEVLESVPSAMPDDDVGEVLSTLIGCLPVDQACCFLELRSQLIEEQKKIGQVTTDPAIRPESDRIDPVIDAMKAIGADNIEDLRAQGTSQSDIAERLEGFGKDLTTLVGVMGIQIDFTGENIKLIERALGLIRNLREPVLNARHAALRESGAKLAVQAAADLQDEARRLERAIPYAQFNITVSSTELRQMAGSLQHASWFSLIKPSIRSARSAWKTTFPLAGSRSNEEMVRDLEAVARVLDIRTDLESDANLKQISGHLFAAEQTDFASLLEAAELFKQSNLMMARDTRAAADIRTFVESAPIETVQRTLAFAYGIANLDFELKVHVGDSESLEDAIGKVREQTDLCASAEQAASEAGLRDVATVDQLEIARAAVIKATQLDESLAELTGQIAWPLGLIESKVLEDEGFITRTTGFFDRLLEAEKQLWRDFVISILKNDPKSNLARLAQLQPELQEALSQVTVLHDSLMSTGGSAANGLLLPDDADLDQAQQMCSRDVSSPPALARRVALNAARADAIRPETVIALRAFEIENGSFDLPDVWETMYWRSVVESVFRTEPRLRRYSGLSLQQARERLKREDERLKILSASRIRAVLSRQSAPTGNGSGPVRTYTERSLVTHLANQTRPRVTVRDFLGRAFRASTALKPCFMMSPASVAQYLQPGRHAFDLVVIDEASQMRTEEAIGALARGKQAVVVGDPMQLPPTPFFRRLGMDDEGPEDDLVSLDEESILERALSAFHPFRELIWHYRSRDESLIAFSNHEFYDDRLIVFPSPAARSSSGMGVHFHYLPSGQSMGGSGSSRTNPVEAENVARFAIRMMEENPSRSLGIAAVNKAQADLIDYEVFRLSADSRKAQDYISRWEDELEQFFVKNLENVQGDERDHIIISSVYTPGGKSGTALNLGPIQQPNGHRRLNVLFTRAKERVDLFSSVVASDINIGENSNRGREVLRNYLDYAATGRIGSGRTDVRSTPDSDFEIAVASHLEQRGFDTDFQVGVAGFRIDIGVRHPDYPHGYIAGIECDGATYHSAKSSRDRDLLRQEILEGLGWQIIRVWSTDWFLDPVGQTNRLVEGLTKVLEEARARPAPEQVWDETELGSDGAIGLEQGSLDETNEIEGTFSSFAVADRSPDDSTDAVMGSRSNDEVDQVGDAVEASLELGLLSAELAPYVDSAAAISAMTTASHPADEDAFVLRTMIEAVINFEGPVHEDVIADRIRTAYDLGRLRGQPRSRALAIMREAGHSDRIVRSGHFFSMDGQQLWNSNRPPRVAGSRSIEQIDSSELNAASVV